MPRMHCSSIATVQAQRLEILLSHALLFLILLQAQRLEILLERPVLGWTEAPALL